MPVAINFASSLLLTRHYVRHQEDFAVTSEQEYLDKAKAFLNAPLDSSTNIEEKQRTRAGVLVEEWVRYDKSTNEFAVVYQDGTIGTYFKPMMLSEAPAGTPRDKMHRRTNNYQYFLEECDLP